MSEELDEARQDALLAARTCAGDLDALSALIDRRRLALFQIAFVELGRYDDAQDAVAEAVVRACRYAARKMPITNFHPWMRRLVRNEARRLRRRVESRHESALTDDGMPIIDGDATRTASSQQHLDLRLEVRAALRRLPTEQARAMTLYYLEGVEVAAIAATIGRPVGTVKWLLSRGRTNLAPLLEGYGTMDNTTPAATYATDKMATAALAVPALSPEKQKALADALALAGWTKVRTIPLADDLLRFTRPQNGEFALPAALNDCGLIVLDERIGRASAFELLPLLAAARRRSDFALLLLLDAGRDAAETDAAVLSAYVSGVDFLLTKPVTIEEFTRFAAQARSVQGKKGIT